MKQLISYMLFIAYTILFFSCHHKLNPIQSTRVFPHTDRRNNPMLLGTTDPDSLRKSPYDTWFVKNYNEYHIDTVVADSLKPLLKGRRLLLFMGTWCGDSQREIPRLLKLFDYCEIPRSDIRMVMVSDADSTYKQSPGHEERGRDIFRVPDCIVLDNKREMGRIIESPVASIEKDLLAITTGHPYTPHYPGTAALTTIFHKEKTSRIRQHLPAIADQLKPLLSRPGELQSYARILKTAGDLERADITLQINNLLFPAGKGQ